MPSTPDALIKSGSVSGEVASNPEPFVYTFSFFGKLWDVFMFLIARIRARNNCIIVIVAKFSVS